VATAVVLAIELALLEPWLSQLLAQRAATLPIGGAPAQLLATTVIFAGVLGAMLLVMGRIAFSWKLPISWPEFWSGNRAPVLSNARASASNNATIPLAARSRAAVIAEAIAASERREGSGGHSAINSGPRRLPANAARLRDDDRRVGAAAPLGHTFPRRVGTRISAGATTRDRQ